MSSQREPSAQQHGHMRQTPGQIVQHMHRHHRHHRQVPLNAAELNQFTLDSNTYLASHEALALGNITSSLTVLIF